MTPPCVSVCGGAWTGTRATERVAMAIVAGVGDSAAAATERQHVIIKFSLETCQIPTQTSVFDPRRAVTYLPH